MGDFCVSGFHSHLPIHNGDKVVSIICKHKQEPMSNCPCYLTGVLVPICLPVVGEMGDYGSLEYYDEDETTRILEELTGKDYAEISEALAMVSEWRTKPEENPEFYDLFKTFHSFESYPGEYKGTRYHMIYEHYDVYKAMTFEWDKVKDAIKSFIIPIKQMTLDNGIDVVINPFRDFMSGSLVLDMLDASGCSRDSNGIIDMIFRTKAKKIYDLNNKIMDFYDKEFENDDIRFYLPFRVMHNFVNTDTGWLTLYNVGQIDLEKSIDAIIDFCSFCIQLDNCEYGHFYFSTAAGQSWHHDKQMWKEQLKVFKVYESIIKKQLKRAPDD